MIAIGWDKILTIMFHLARFIGVGNSIVYISIFPRKSSMIGQSPKIYLNRLKFNFGIPASVRGMRGEC